MGVFEWLTALAKDADPATEGFQPSWFYVFWNVVFPAAFGVTVSFLFGLVRDMCVKSKPEETS